MNIGNIILWIIFGGLAGWLASLIVGGTGLGVAGNVIVGVIGAFLGGWIADKVGVGGQPGIERPTTIRSFVTAVIGAILLLLIINLIF